MQKQGLNNMDQCGPIKNRSGEPRAAERLVIDIEHLLIWVYSKQLPHYGTLISDGGSGGNDPAALGTKVDGTRAWDCDPDAERMPSRRAFVVHTAERSARRPASKAGDRV
ncbi:MAG: hypothetical protein OSB58_14700 [Alphaproteobacteria bacterium]|nr:hypothetical protein [Alphaproteobacteria bacterium]